MKRHDKLIRMIQAQGVSCQQDDYLDELGGIIERLVKERDAAVADLRDECGCTFCRFGKYEISELPRRCRDCFHLENWEWRGAQE